MNDRKKAIDRKLKKKKSKKGQNPIRNETFVPDFIKLLGHTEHHLKDLQKFRREEENESLALGRWGVKNGYLPASIFKNFFKCPPWMSQTREKVIRRGFLLNVKWRFKMTRRAKISLKFGKVKGLNVIIIMAG